MKKRYLLLTLFLFSCLAWVWTSQAPLFLSRPGVASWYERKSHQYGCASWDYPIGSFLKITNTENGRFVICRVEEKGPDKKLGRLVDLSKPAFSELANPDVGTLVVKVQRLDKRT